MDQQVRRLFGACVSAALCIGTLVAITGIIKVSL